MGYDYISVQANPRDGHTAIAILDEATRLDYPPASDGFSANGKAFFSIFERRYSGQSDRLFIGVPTSDKLRLVAQQIDISGGWSPDGNTLAYIYNVYALYDYSVYIAITDYAGNNKRIQVLNPIERDGMARFAGWSADGKYLAVATFGDRPTVYYFVATDTLQVVAASITASFQYEPIPSGMAWSSQGHRFAYLDFDDIAKISYLAIATPENGIERKVDLHSLTKNFVQLPLVWSPDGRYVALHSYTAEETYDNGGRKMKWEYWTYSILGIDGSIRTGIKGQKLYLPDPKLPDGWWSADGTTWVFWQQLYAYSNEENDKNISSYLMAYHVENDTYQMLADHVAGSPLQLDGGAWFAIPVWNKDKIKLMLLSSDGSQRRNINLEFDEIVDMRWLNERRMLAYIARRGDTFTFGLIDLKTGESPIQLDGFPEQSFIQSIPDWQKYQRLTLSPSGNILILKVGKIERQSIIIISIVTKSVQPIRMEGYKLGDIYWSPDESAFAFTQYDDIRQINTLQVVSDKGETLRQIDLYGGKNSLVGWTWCQ